MCQLEGALRAGICFSVPDLVSRWRLEVVFFLIDTQAEICDCFESSVTLLQKFCPPLSPIFLPFLFRFLRILEIRFKRLNISHLRLLLAPPRQIPLYRIPNHVADVAKKHHAKDINKIHPHFMFQHLIIKVSGETER